MNRRVSVQSFRLNRRAVLRGLAGIGVALPLLDVMLPARQASAQDGAVTRFIVMFSQSGTVYDRWLPQGGETDFQLSDILAPLEPYRSEIMVVGGLRNDAGMMGPGDDHSKGMGTILTGTSLTDNGNLQAGGISLDQEIANQIGGGTRFKSLECGVQSGSGHITNYMCHSGPSQPIPVENDPGKVFDRIFSDFSGPDASAQDTAASDLALVQRQSVLDAVTDSYESLLPRVSVEDRGKLEAHLENIRGIENQLSNMATTAVGAGCANPGKPSVDSRSNDGFPAVGKAQLDLIHMAQACDLTRVSAIQFSRESADPRFSWLGMSQGHHTISHEPDSNSGAIEDLVAINRWHAEQFAYLVDKLANTAEGAGTQLDNSLVLWVNGLAKGNFHSHDPQPNVLAGRAGGSLTPGRFLDFGGSRTSTNELYVGILNALGIPATSFGSHGNGALTGFLA